MDNKVKGAMWMTISALGMAFMSLSVKFVGMEISTFEKLFFRSLVTSILSIYPIRKDLKQIWGSNNKSRVFILFRCGFGITGAVLYFYSIDRLYLANSSLLNKLSPVFITIFATIFLKEHLKKYQIYLLIVTLIGALLVIKPTLNFEIIPSLAGFSSAIFAGAAYTLLRYLRTMENPSTLVLWFSVFSTLAMIPFMMIEGFVVPNKEQFFYLILTGVFSTVGQFGLALAYKHSKANEVSIYQYLSIIFSAILGYLLWNEIPDLYTIIGAILILGTAYLNYRFSLKNGGEDGK